MANLTATFQLHNPDTGLPFEIVVHSNTDLADLANISTKKIALIRAVMDSGTVSNEYAQATGEDLPAVNSGGVGADAVLILKKTISGVRTTVTQKINEMSSSYRLTGSPGLVNIADSAIAAFGSAYRNSAGVNGWTVTAGYYKD